MDTYERLAEVLEGDVARFSVHAANPAAAPDLYGVDDLNAKAMYYRKYVDAIREGRDRLMGAIEAKDDSALAKAVEALEFQHFLNSNKGWAWLDVSGYAEGQARVLDRVCEIRKSMPIEDAEASALAPR